MMRDLNALAIFAKVVEARSFSGAARALQMPVSTVSRRIAQLERRLGVRLLERSTRSVRLTDVGSEVIGHACHSTELCEAVASLISNSLAEVSGALRLGAPPVIGESLIVPVVSAFQVSYPAVQVQVQISERLGRGISDDVDIAFAVGSCVNADAGVRKLLTYRHQLVASPAYLAGREPPRTPRDLPAHRLLAFSPWRPDYHWSFAHVAGDRRERLAFEPCVAINDYAALAGALLAGGGIGELPPIIHPELLRNGLLVEMLPEWHLPRVHLVLGSPRRGHPPRQVRVFREFVTQMVPKLFPSLPA
jgi:DNA-binding transcriptional LysR family regulator